MTVVVQELYQALLKAGVDEPLAMSAARSVVAAEDKAGLATKADLVELRLAVKADLSALEAALAWKIGALVVGALVSMTGIFAVIVRWLTKVG